MRADYHSFQNYQVFLNYPFDEPFEPLANAMHFAIVAANLIPVCAQDLTVPDRPRLEMIVDTIINCHYSIHDLSRGKGEGSENYARMNMPLEMGMALFYALQSQRSQHRCVFFVDTPYTYHKYASDLSGLDPKSHYNDELTLVAIVYEWLRFVAYEKINVVSTSEVKDCYSQFKLELAKLVGSSKDGRPSHDEAQELMYVICSDRSWWEWRNTKPLKSQFPSLPLTWKSTSH